MLFITLLIVILASAVACLWNRGLWTAALTFINTVFAALLTMNFFEPVANLINSDGKSNTWTFLCFWGMFAVFSMLFRVTTDFASQTRVRFPYGVDVAGAVLLALWTGWVVFCFAMVSLHVSPLPAKKFVDAPDEKMMGVSPDRLWLAFTRQVSIGAFSNSEGGFDQDGEFIFKYAANRAPKQ